MTATLRQFIGGCALHTDDAVLTRYGVPISLWTTPAITRVIAGPPASEDETEATWTVPAAAIAAAAAELRRYATKPIVVSAPYGGPRDNDDEAGWQGVVLAQIAHALRARGITTDPWAWRQQQMMLGARADAYREVVGTDAEYERRSTVVGEFNRKAGIG